MRIGIFWAVLAVSAASPAMADIVEFEFTGATTFGSGVFAGATDVSGSFSYDTDLSGFVVPSNPPDTVGRYWGFLAPNDANGTLPGWSATVRAAGLTFQTSGVPGTIQIDNDRPLPNAPLDRFSYALGSALEGSLNIQLSDPSASAFQDLSLPAGLSLNDFATATGFLSVPPFVPSDPNQLSFAITGLQRTEPVPEPGTLALCGAAAAAYLWRRRRQHSASNEAARE